MIFVTAGVCVIVCYLFHFFKQKFDELTTNDGDSEIQSFLKSIDRSFIDRWGWRDKHNKAIYVNDILCQRLSGLKIGETIFLYKSNHGVYNFKKESKNLVLQVNSATKKRTVLKRSRGVCPVAVIWSSN